MVGWHRAAPSLEAPISASKTPAPIDMVRGSHLPWVCMRLRSFHCLFSAALLTFAVNNTIHAATTIWDPTPVQVNNNGVFADTYAQFISTNPVYAYYASPSFSGNIQIGGVTFSAIPNFNIDGGGSYGSTPLNTGNTNWNSILSDGFQGGNGVSPISFTLTSLNVGMTYAIQIFSGSNYGWTVNGQSFLSTVTGQNWYAMGSAFVVGTFTADATTQTYTLSEGRPELNAVIVAAVPETSTSALLGIGTIGMLLVMRRKRVIRQFLRLNN